MKTVLAKAVGGGIPGAVAMVLQVLCLMWLRTTVNYQMVTGVSFTTALRTLYAEGGIRRFYQGLTPALLQGPLSRFGDTAANSAAHLLDWNVASKTLVASVAAALWRLLVAPLDTIKTVLQVGGPAALRSYKGSYYAGALGSMFATLVGHYPWFVTNNFLEVKLPQAKSRRGILARRAFIGFCSSLASDCVANSVRVVKTVAQTNPRLGYFGALTLILDKDGIQGLLFRGLAAKIVANAISSILFSILWKMIMAKWDTSSKKHNK